jgi:hypothetical protein
VTFLPRLPDERRVPVALHGDGVSAIEAKRRHERAQFEEYFPLRKPSDTPNPNLTQLLWDLAWGAWQARAGLPPAEDAGFSLIVTEDGGQRTRVRVDVAADRTISASIEALDGGA